MKFENRREAGQFLAQKLKTYANQAGVLVLGLPRGGVPVAYEVARALNAPLDVYVVRKLGMPGEEELALGAIGPGGVRVFNQEVLLWHQIPAELINQIVAREQQELERREQLYRDNRPPRQIQGQLVILVDDGLATGSTMRAAIAALRRQNPARIVVAVPTAAPETCREFAKEVDEIVCAITPEPFYAVGLWYKDFSQTSDEEVRALLSQAASARVK